MNLSSANRVVVTGGAGFVGQHLIRSLLGQGASVETVVLAGADEQRMRDLGFPIPVRVIASGEELGAAVRGAEPTEVVHLGAILDNRPTAEALERTLTANLLSSVSLMQALVGGTTRRVVLMGSCEEYGRNETPFDPRLAVDPPTPYAASKAAVTAYARMFFHAFGLGTVVLRPAVIYGFGQNPRMLISDVMGALLRGEPVDVTLGEQERDFLYIDDMVAAIESALTAPGIEGGTFNIGTGTVTTVRECIGQIEALVGRPGLVRWGARAYSKNETFRYTPDCREATRQLQWKATVDLPTGLATMVAQMRESASKESFIV
jgi:nucleoside-diphosphate-sugar epimerase